MQIDKVIFYLLWP